jgi:hypothetical protein
LHFEVVPPLLFEDVFKFQSNFLKSDDKYILNVNRLLPFGHELIDNLGKDFNIPLCVSPKRIYQESLLLLAKEAFEVFVDDFQAS